MDTGVAKNFDWGTLNGEILWRWLDDDFRWRNNDDLTKITL